MAESTTPLSDLIELCLDQKDPATDAANFERFLACFVTSRLGVIASGALGHAKLGEKIVVREGQVSCATVDLPGGVRMLLACADRPVFLRRYARRFNAEVDARTLMTIALAGDACKGIMISSARSDRSIALARELLPKLIDRCREPAPVAWKRAID